MWISRKEYNKLLNDRNELVGMMNCMLNRVVDKEEQTASLQVNLDTEQELTNKALNMLDNVINITFEGNKGFETVVFQKYGCAPEIFYKGKKVKIEPDTAIRIIYKDCKAGIKKKSII